MAIEHLNHSLYTDLPIDELDQRLAVEELETKLEMDCYLDWCAVQCQVVVR